MVWTRIESIIWSLFTLKVIDYRFRCLQSIRSPSYTSLKRLRSPRAEARYPKRSSPFGLPPPTPLPSQPRSGGDGNEDHAWRRSEPV